MFKGFHFQKGSGASLDRARLAATSGAAAILFATSTVAVAQGMTQSIQGSVAPVHSAAAGSEASLSLARAIEIALEGNADVAAATRQVEATEGQIIQGRARPNPELAYSLEDTRSATRTQS